MKRTLISVKNSISPYEVDIHSGTTPSQIIARLQLDENYVLSKKSDPTTSFSVEELLYPLITHEEHLIAQTIIDVADAFLELIVFGSRE